MCTVSWQIDAKERGHAEVQALLVLERIPVSTANEDEDGEVRA